MSFQRYALLFAGGAALALSCVAVFAPTVWWLWLIAILLAGKLLLVAREIAGRYPRKLRALTVGMRRIARGNFDPTMVRNYCTDPCYRVVAHTLLKRAGVPAEQRRRLVREFTAEIKREQNKTFIFNMSEGTATEIDAEGSRPFVPELQTPQAK